MLDYGEAEGEKVGDMIKDGGTDFRVRGSIHLLLIGEPSTAKSALLRASCRLAGRAIFTAATGSTAAGLTAAAVRDTSGWALEAGALVLADGGVCAIDEFTSLRGADRAAVHEAMEQQTVSLAKAGLVTRLNCRCAVIAASSLPADAEHSPNLLPTPLLSRFDLVWRLLDPVGCEAWDSAVADHVLGFKAAEANNLDNRRVAKLHILGSGRIPTSAFERCGDPASTLLRTAQAHTTANAWEGREPSSSRQDDSASS